MTVTHRDALLKRLARDSFKLGEFKLSSGGVSDYYVDCRTTTLSGEGGRLTGVVILDLIVDPNGHARGIHVLRGAGVGLDEKAIEAVQKWKFSPGKNKGVPVKVRATVEVNFRLL